MSHRLLLTVLAVGFLAAPSTSRAQSSVYNASNARFDATGTGFAVVASPDVLPAWRGGGGLTLHVADKPFALYREGSDGQRALDQIVQQSTLVVELHGGFGLGGIADLGLVLPVAPVVVWGAAGGDFAVRGADGPALGDLTLIPRVQILNPTRTKYIGFGVQLPVSLPTGQKDSYLGDGGVNFAVDLLAELRVWKFRVLANLAPIHIQPRFEFGDVARQFGMDFGGGVSFQMLQALALRVEAWGSMSYVGTASKANGEWAASVSMTPSDVVQLDLGFGSGIGGFAVPTVRAFAGVRVTAPRRPAAVVEEAPAEEAPAVEAPEEEAPTEEAPAEEAPEEVAPLEEVAPIEEVAPAEEAPVEQEPAVQAPVEEAPGELPPVEPPPAPGPG